MVTTPRLTYQDYVNLEGAERYELLDGQLILVAAPNEDHQTVRLRMIARMNAFVEEHQLGRPVRRPGHRHRCRPARLDVRLHREGSYQDSGQHQGSARPDSGNIVPLLV